MIATRPRFGRESKRAFDDQQIRTVNKQYAIGNVLRGLLVTIRRVQFAMWLGYESARQQT
eukprot:9452470-Lingulodinium_polyedra.AAC.1